MKIEWKHLLRVKADESYELFIFALGFGVHASIAFDKALQTYSVVWIKLTDVTSRAADSQRCLTRDQVLEYINKLPHN